MDAEGPLGDCLCTNQAAWGEGRAGGWVAEGVRGTHTNMGLTGATLDACMDHLKRVQGPRNRQGFQDACTVSLCPQERQCGTRTGDLLLDPRFSWFL